MSASKAAADAFRTLAHARHSCKRFQRDQPISKNVLKDIIRTSITSPSGFNIQPTNVILLRNQNLKENLAKTAMLGPGNIYRTNDCSAIAIFLSDLQPHKRLDRILQLETDSNVRTKQYLATLPITSTFLMGQGKLATVMKQVATNVMSPSQPMPTIDSIQAWSYKNTSLMAMNFCLAATSHGLSTCLMEGYDTRRVKDLLRIPDRYDVPLMCSVGYEYEGDDKEECGKTPRLEPEEVFFSDLFGQQLDLDLDFGDKDDLVIEKAV